MEYIKDPDEIYKLSFATIKAEAELHHIPSSLQSVIVRMIHACGVVNIAQNFAWQGENFSIPPNAPILCDCEMLTHGIIKRYLRGNPVICTLNHPDIPNLAQKLNTTRSAAALELWRDHLDQGAIVAIGNAPTALFRLLELVASGVRPPLLTLGFPVGFVGAAESKEALIESQLPALALKGRMGGSAIAAAALNALLALED